MMSSDNLRTLIMFSSAPSPGTLAGPRGRTPEESREERKMIDTRHLYDVRAVARPPVRTAAPLGVRSSNIVQDGVVSGERIRGHLLPAGGDWMLVDAAGAGHVDARYIIQT